MDIRNFFGGGGAKPVSAKTAAKTAPSPNKKREVDEDVFDVLDSDEEDNEKPARRKLKTSKDKAAAAATGGGAKASTKSPAKSTPSKGAVSPAKTKTPENVVIELNDDGMDTGDVSTSHSSLADKSVKEIKAMIVERGLESEAVGIFEKKDLINLLEKNTTTTSSTKTATTSAAATSQPTLKPLGTKDGLSSDKKRKPVSTHGFFGEEAPPPAPVSATNKQSSMPSSSTSSNSFVPSTPDSKKMRLDNNNQKSVPATATAHNQDTNDNDKFDPYSARNECLDGIKFVVTGVFSFGREKIEDLIKRYGGKLGSGVSGATNYLVCGHTLEDGRAVETGRKYTTAIEKDVKIMNEDEFFAFMKLQSLNGNVMIRSPTKSPGSSKKAKNSNVAASLANFKFAPKTGFGAPVSSSSSSSSSSSTSSSSSSSSSVEEQMWVDKYKPSHISQVIANQDIVKKLSDWVTRWEAAHLGAKTFKWNGPSLPKDMNCKAALLSGPPGIGKTTVVHLVAKQLGYEVYELNASDTRSKKAVTEMVKDVVQSQALNPNGSIKKRIVIMDEVDGMGGSDRGGIPELIKVIKESKTPIICICNDRQAQKIKSLANHCFDLRVKRPTKQQIGKRLVEIAANEGLAVEPNAAEALVEQVGNDIRQCLHTLQMWRAQSNTMRYSELKDGMQRIEKDRVLRSSPFEAVLQILAGPKCAFSDRFESFFIDYSFIPLMIQENYINNFKGNSANIAGKDESLVMERLSQACDAVSDMELCGASLMGQDQHWELLPAQAGMCLRVGHLVQGFQGFPQFPSWLGKNSTTTKKKRLTKEIVSHSLLSIGQGFSAIRMEYIPYLRNILLKPLQVQGAEGVDECIRILDAYGFSKDDLGESMRELGFIKEGDAVLKDHFSELDSKVKAALTRTYNATGHRSQALVAEQGVKKSRGRGGGGGGGGDDGDDVVHTIEDLSAAKDINDDDDVDDDVGDVSAFAKAARKKGGGSSSSGGSAAASKAKSTASKPAAKATTTAKKGGKK